MPRLINKGNRMPAIINKGTRSTDAALGAAIQQYRGEQVGQRRLGLAQPLTKAGVGAATPPTGPVVRPPQPAPGWGAPAGTTPPIVPPSAYSTPAPPTGYGQMGPSPVDGYAPGGPTGPPPFDTFFNPPTVPGGGRGDVDGGDGGAIVPGDPNLDPQDGKSIPRQRPPNQGRVDALNRATANRTIATLPAQPAQPAPDQPAAPTPAWKELQELGIGGQGSAAANKAALEEARMRPPTAATMPAPIDQPVAPPVGAGGGGGYPAKRPVRYVKPSWSMD